MTVHRTAAWVLGLSGVSRLVAGQETTVLLADAVVMTTDRDVCLRRQALAQRIGAWLQQGRIDAAIRVEVTVLRAGMAASFRMLRNGTVTAERTFAALPAACALRIDAVSLAVALAIDSTLIERISSGAAGMPLPESAPETPSAVAAQAAKSGASSAAATTVPRPRTPVAPPLLSARAAPPPSDWSVFAGGAALFGLPLGSGFAGSLGIDRWAGPRFSSRLSGIGTLESTMTLGRGHVHGRLVAGRLDACLNTPWGRRWINVCFGGAGGVLRARGSGFVTLLGADEAWAAAAASASMELPMTSSLALRLRVDGFVPFVRPRFHVMTPDGEVLDRRSPAAVEAGAGLDVVVRLP